MNMELIPSPSPVAEESPTALCITVDMERNVYSQSGEDGIIETILTAIGDSTVQEGMVEGRRFCVDIGAHNGIFCSNTANLRDKGWSSLLIEQDSTHTNSLTSLQGTTAVIETITPENAVSVVFGSGWPAEKCDLLSCDVDGDDVAIVKSLISGEMRPIILVVEYNPTYPPFLYRLNELGRSQGSSLKAVIDELSPLEYDCVYATISNVILVDRRRNSEKVRVMNTFEAFRWDDVRFVCSDFDGQNHLATMSRIMEEVVNPWDRIPSAKVARYPERLLGYSEEMAKLRRAVWEHSF